MINTKYVLIFIGNMVVSCMVSNNVIAIRVNNY